MCCLPNHLMKKDSVRADQCRHCGEEVIMFRQDRFWVHSNCRGKECKSGDTVAEPMNEPMPFG